jgi:RNA polymerase sigma-70 factor (ECF subfamily)
MSEEEIIKGCQNGKQKCQKLVYDQHSKLVMGIALRFAKNENDAYDIFQDSFLKVFLYIQNFKFLGSFEGWVRKIAVTTAISWYRKQVADRKNGLEVELVEDYPEVTIEDGIDISMDELLLLVNELPDGYRMVFNLFAIDGYKHEEIADMLNITEGTSRSQYFKAKHTLQKKIIEKYKINAI